MILGTPEASRIMSDVLKDIIATTGGKLDLLVATHEHWDHLSGFVQAEALFKKLQVSETWLSWAEDPNDKLASKLRGERQAMRATLGAAQSRLRLLGATEIAGDLANILDFFGATGAGTTAQALEIVRHLSDNIRYCRPEDPPFSPDGVAARFYVLGPPRDEKMIRKINPSRSHPETYGLAGMETFMFAVSPPGEEEVLDAPFGRPYWISAEASRNLPFFRDHYWGGEADPDRDDSAWRQIETAWLELSSSLAIHLDSATNNTSLVFAIELADGDVLLFAADAQVCNWLSWEHVSWESAGRTVEGAELLRRAILYKVGHHGSHNATLRERGLELMERLQLALLPVDHEMAVTKRWTQMPFPELVSRLDEVTRSRCSGSIMIRLRPCGPADS